MRLLEYLPGRMRFKSAERFYLAATLIQPRNWDFLAPGPALHYICS